MLVATAPQPVCTPDTIQQLLIDSGRLDQSAVENGEIVDLVRCGDITADGIVDALFTVASGGTAGDTRFGVLAGKADGTPDHLITLRSGYKIGIARRSSRSFEVLQPHYGRNDPNCCPSSFRLTRYTWTGTNYRASKARKLKHAPKRFYRP